MDARTIRVAILAAAALSLGASHRTRNFIVSARTPQFAAEVAQAAEQQRRDLAVEWLGTPLPDWTHPCPIEVRDSPTLGAGGATSFSFSGRVPGNWTMTIQGSQERILDSVLPHEITHTVFATHFGCPLPRWADEGACTTVEHRSERAKQEQMLIEFLTTRRGIPFNRMFAMREYPRDIMPLYSQGFSLARFLIAQGGKRKFVDYVGEGLQSNDWNIATRKYYGYQNLSELQLTWVDWVGKGSPALPAQSATLVSTTGVASGEARQAAADRTTESTAGASLALESVGTESLASEPMGSEPLASESVALLAAPPSPPAELVALPALEPAGSEAEPWLGPGSVRQAAAELLAANQPSHPAATASQPAARERNAGEQDLSGSWYARRRDEQRGRTVAEELRAGPVQRAAGDPPPQPTPASSTANSRTVTRPQPPQAATQRVLQWRR